MIGPTCLSTSVFSPLGVLTINGGLNILGFTFNFLTILYDMNECVQPESNSNEAEIPWIEIIP